MRHIPRCIYAQCRSAVCVAARRKEPVRPECYPPGAYPPPEGLKIQIFHHNILTITPSGDSAGYTVQNSV